MSSDSFEEGGLEAEVQKAIDNLAESPEFAQALFEIGCELKKQLDVQARQSKRHRLIHLFGSQEQTQN